jgi:zinc/manganese transport system ATP-binding protein
MPEEHQERQLLQVENVSVAFGERTVLDDVSFSIRAGEFTGLIGSNGAGKTTLMRVILGLERPGSGRVLIEGAPRTPRNRSIGYVPQKVLLDHQMPLRARDLVALGIDGNRFGFPMPSKQRRDAVDEMLEAVDALSFADARVGTLSGGEQQRVLIAHALVGRPELLLLDEPLANLDIKASQDVVALLDRIAHEQKIAIFLSAHEMNPLLPVMDRIVYIAEGRAASGTIDEVVRDDVLSALYGQEVHVHVLHGRILVVAGPTELTDVSPATGLETVLP